MHVSTSKHPLLLLLLLLLLLFLFLLILLLYYWKKYSGLRLEATVFSMKTTSTSAWYIFYLKMFKSISSSQYTKLPSVTTAISASNYSVTSFFVEPWIDRGHSRHQGELNRVSALKILIHVRSCTSIVWHIFSLVLLLVWAEVAAARVYPICIKQPSYWFWHRAACYLHEIQGASRESYLSRVSWLRKSCCFKVLKSKVLIAYFCFQELLIETYQGLQCFSAYFWKFLVFQCNIDRLCVA